VALLASLVELLFADAADVRHIAGRRGRGVSGRVVVGLVQAEVLLDLEPIGTLDDDRLDRPGEQLGVVDVGACQLEPERTARPLDDQALLAARFASISGIRPLFPPPKRALPIHPSAACHDQSTPPSSSHSLSSTVHNSSNTPSLTKR